MHIALTEQSVGTFDSGVAKTTVFDRCLASDFVVARARKSTRRKQETVKRMQHVCSWPVKRLLCAPNALYCVVSASRC